MVLGYLRRDEPRMYVANEANLALRPFRQGRPFPTEFRQSERFLKYYLPNSSRAESSSAHTDLGLASDVCEVKMSAAQRHRLRQLFETKQQTTTQHYKHTTTVLEALRHDSWKHVSRYRVIKF